MVIPTGKTERLIIPLGGISDNSAQPRGIYGPAVDAVTSALGQKTITRASHVDPGSELSNEARDWLYTNHVGPIGDTMAETEALLFPPDKWFADLQPSDGPVLGPFDTRDIALQAESEWLHVHNIPVSPIKIDSDLISRRETAGDATLPD